MNFDLDEDQQLFRDAIERFLGPIDIAERRRQRAQPGAYPAERWQRLAELGLIALAAPEDSGGLGGSLIDLVLAAEALGRGLAIDPWLENGVLPVRLAAKAKDHQLVEALITGKCRAALAFAEPGRHFNLDPKNVRADGAHEISGTKTFVPGGATADLLLVTAAGPTGFGLYAITPVADRSAVQRRGYIVTDGSMAAEIDFHRAGASCLPIGASGFRDVIADIRLLAAAEMLGIMQRLFDDTVDYVKNREQFGVAIGTFQVLQHRLVDCYALLEQARSLVWRTALEASSAGTGWLGACAGTKAAVGDAAVKVALEAVQMHGGMGQTEELAIGHGLKRIMLLDRLFGDQDTCLAEFAASSVTQACAA
jgi:alkylation response protein AidB-like acyl-CoA dehydrogenase